MTYREWLKDRRDENIDPCRAYNSGYNLAVKYMTTLMEPLKAGSFEKGKQVERERIRARVKMAAISSWSAGEVYIGPEFILLQKFVERLLEDGSGNPPDIR